MTIQEIFYSEDISIRSFNVCVDNDLIDLNSILNYFVKNKTFVNLRNCGVKSNNELLELCSKYFELEKIEKIEIKKNEESLNSIIINLTRKQRDVINMFIEININNLSNRSKKALYSFLDGNIKIRNISDRILTDVSFNASKIQNIGSKSLNELNSFISLLIKFIETISEVVNESDLISINNRFFLEKKFALTETPPEILESQSIFKLTDYLIKKNVVFEENHSIVFKKTFKIYENTLEVNFDDISDELFISYERIRQIRKNCLEELINKLLFIKTVDDDLFQKYGIDLTQNFIFISNDLKKRINDINDTVFSNEFITLLIYVYVSDKFDLIGNIEDVLLPKFSNSRIRHNWDNLYLVNKNLSNEFDFISFTNDLEFRLYDRIEEDYCLNLKSYIIDFFGSKKIELISSISKVSEIILINEFGIYIDGDENIRFVRNSLKQAYEYAYEALKLIGRPSKVYEITRKIEELYLDFETNDAKVRASMKRKNGFIPLGQSVFGLKEWENELENFKDGTIREIVYEYLDAFHLPKHISEISKFVLKYRPSTYDRSILDNLKADDTGTFVFFKSSQIGLSNKRYANSFIQFNQIENQITKSWEERFNDLTNFIKINDRLPSPSCSEEEEASLYRWYNIQRGRIKIGNLDEKKSKLLSNVLSQFDIKI